MRKRAGKLERKASGNKINDATVLTSKPEAEIDTEEDSQANPEIQNCTRILVVIRQSIVRFGVASLLDDQSDFKVVGTASNCAECHQKVQTISPHVLLCDLEISIGNCPVNDANFCQNSGEALTNALPDIPSIVLQDDKSDCQILEASRVGIRGYLTTDSKCEDLFRAIRVVRNGGSFLEQQVQSEVLGMLKQINDSEKIKGSLLNDRELTILDLLAQGKRNQEIADTVFLSKSSVKRYISNLYAKLGASNRAEAVRIGISKSLIRSQ